MIFIDFSLLVREVLFNEEKMTNDERDEVMWNEEEKRGAATRDRSFAFESFWA